MRSDRPATTADPTAPAATLEWNDAAPPAPKFPAPTRKTDAAIRRERRSAKAAATLKLAA